MLWTRHISVAAAKAPGSVLRSLIYVNQRLEALEDLENSYPKPLPGSLHKLEGAICPLLRDLRLLLTHFEGGGRKGKVKSGSRAREGLKYKETQAFLYPLVAPQVKRPRGRNW